jgi:hypothetical protein
MGGTRRGEHWRSRLPSPKGVWYLEKMFGGSDIPEHTGRGEQVPESSVPLPLRSAGSGWNAQLDDSQLHRLSSSTVQRIARVLSTRLYSGEGASSARAEEDIGSTKREHAIYIIRAQQELTEKGIRMDLLSVWKEMGLIV